MGNNQSNFSDLSTLLEAIGDQTEFLGVPVTDVNCVGLFGTTPLHVVATWNDVNAINLLINKGANLNVVDFEGSTPLHDAIEQGNYQAVELLLQKGCSVSLKNNDGHSPYDLAIILEENDIAKLIKETKGDIYDK